MPMDFVYGMVGFLLTLMVLSYLIGDNALFRFAIHLFVGVSAGVAASVVIDQVLWPSLIFPLFSASMNERLLLMVPLLLGALLLMKASPRLSWLGGPAMAYLTGAGAAVAVSGAVLGTLFPQAAAAAEPFHWRAMPDPLGYLVSGIFMLVATISTLAYFHFGARRQEDGSVHRNGLIEALAWLGGLFVAFTLGTLFAGVYAAALSAFIERIHALLSFLGF